MYQTHSLYLNIRHINNNSGELKYSNNKKKEKIKILHKIKNKQNRNSIKLNKIVDAPLDCVPVLVQGPGSMAELPDEPSKPFGENQFILVIVKF